MTSIRAEIIGDASVVSRLRRLGTEADQGVYSAISRLSLRLQRSVKQGKLTGQVLKVRTGTLRRSIQQSVERRDKDITGIVGTNVRYGQTHEYGFQGPVTIPEHVRVVKQAFGRALKEPRSVLVRPHVRQVNLPARSFLRTALREMKPEIPRAIERAILKAER